MRLGSLIRAILAAIARSGLRDYYSCHHVVPVRTSFDDVTATNVSRQGI